jgi:ubiquitin-conjugating enzyme E2 variant
VADANHGKGVPPPHQGLISLGLADSGDVTLSSWNCSLIGWPNSSLDGRLYTLKVVCSELYPDVPPAIRFISKINMHGVDQKTGVVSPSLFTGWTRQSTIASAMCLIRNHLKTAAKLTQPPEGEEYRQ